MKITDFRTTSHPYKLFGRTAKPFSAVGGGDVSANSETTLYDTNRVNTPFGGPAFTFTRASSATMVNSSGVLVSVGNNVMREVYNPASARTNLVRNSGNLDIQTTSGDNSSFTQYRRRGCTVVVSTVASDITKWGAGKVFEVTEDPTTDSHALQSPKADQPTATTSRVASVSVRAGTATRVALTAKNQFLSNNDNRVIFDLVSGTVVNAVSYASYGIYSEGDGWWRVWAVVPAAPGNNFTSVTLQTVSDTNTTNSFLGTGRTFYYARPMMEAGTVATSYIETNTSTVTLCEKLGYLPEEARTNLALNSNDFGTTWTLWQATRSQVANVAPDGTTSVWKITENTGTQAHWVQQVFSGLDTAKVYSFSAFVKAAERDQGRLIISTTSDTANNEVRFNLTTGALSAAFGTQLVDYGLEAFPNGWYRVWVSATASDTTQKVRIVVSDAAGSYSYTGDGVSGLLVFGGQFEEGAFATSYIPTTTAAVTRSSDILQTTDTSFMNFAAGTFYVEGYVAKGGLVLGLDRFGGAPRGHAWSTAGGAGFYIANTGFQISIADNTPVALGSFFKAVYAYTSGDTYVARNGTVTVSSGSTAPYPWGVPTRFVIGLRHLSGFGGYNAWCNTPIKKVTYRPWVMGRAAAASLTTL